MSDGETNLKIKLMLTKEVDSFLESLKSEIGNEISKLLKSSENAQEQKRQAKTEVTGETFNIRINKCYEGGVVVTEYPVTDYTNDY
ncbi:hypothetical protein KY366_08590 [Candidatus Woesearchaeota archaeon]|nr:hypothetical protein [Candidatus Woesearchaeota archaeon]